MKRIDGTTKRTKLTVAGLFLVVALASAGCGNALVNPQLDQTATGGGNVSTAGNNVRPAGNELHPAGNNLRP
jgi:hypothetical protein